MGLREEVDIVFDGNKSDMDRTVGCVLCVKTGQERTGQSKTI